MKKIALLLLGAATVWTSCKPDVDETAPTMQVTSITPAVTSADFCDVTETNVLEVETGGTIDLSLSFADDVELSQYKIDIHDNFDCHEHGKTLAPWSVLEVIDITGTEQTIEKSITIPGDVRAGGYDFFIKVLDAAGNEGVDMEYKILLTNTDDIVAPTAQLVAPTASPVVVTTSSTISIELNLSDNLDLDGGEMELVYEANDEDVEILHEEFAAGTGTSTTVMHDFTVPSDLPAGTYPVEVFLYDAVGNLTELEAFEMTIQ